MPELNLITENGWRQITSDMLDRGFIPGSSKVRLETRAGDVTTILKAWVAWFDRNVEDVEYNYEPRDEWGWSATNSVWNSNHLSGTAVDINATKYPMGYYRMEGWKVDKVREGLRLFEGTVFWGRSWTTPDEMHFQIQGNAQQIAGFAQRLRDGYLGLWAPEKPADPLAYRLPTGYYYGPLDGPNESVSGLWKTDSQWAKDGLGLWQEKVGIPVSKHWDDTTAQTVVQLQIAKGWFNDDNPYKGRLYAGEWDAVVREGWKPSAPVEPFGVYWNDISQWQDIPVDNSYPHRVFCFRALSREFDTLAPANYREAKRMADEGRLDCIIVYAFLWPDRDTIGMLRKFFADNGGVHPKVCIMLDVEDAGGKITADCTAQANDFIEQAITLVGNDPRRVCGYQNFVINSHLWKSRRADLKMIIPNYSLRPGQRPNGPQFFAHQFTQTGRTAPWGDRDVDINYYAGTLSAFLAAFGLSSGERPAGDEESDPAWLEIAEAVGVIATPA